MDVCILFSVSMRSVAVDARVDARPLEGKDGRLDAEAGLENDDVGGRLLYCAAIVAVFWSVNGAERKDDCPVIGDRRHIDVGVDGSIVVEGDLIAVARGVLLNRCRLCFAASIGGAATLESGEHEV